MLAACCSLLILARSSSAEMAPTQERVLLVGDSWAHVMWLEESLRTAFDESGYGDIHERGAVTAIGGSRASQWKAPDKLALIASELRDHPSINLVHISLGGNDFFKNWKTSLSPEEETQVLSHITGDLSVLIQYILSQRDDISVLLCGYSYLNFEETRESGLVPWCACSGESALWPVLGMPTPLQVNTGLAHLEDLKADLAKGEPHITHINNLGLMQYWFGYPSKGIQPGTVPLPDGNPELPSPPEALNNGLDCAHLSPEGYLVLARNCVKEFYFLHFLPTGKKIPIHSLAAGEGTVSSISGTVIARGELKMGDLASNGISRAIVSFDTSGIPDDATVSAARIFLTCDGSCGMNPMGAALPQGEPVCDVLADIQGIDGIGKEDWERIPAVSNAGLFAGSLKAKGWKLRIDLKKEALESLNHHGKTRFRLGFTKTDGNSHDDLVTFVGTDGTDPEKSPLLEVFMADEVSHN